MFDRTFTPEAHRKRASPWAGAPLWAIELGAMLYTLIESQDKTMAAIDDLKSAIADLATQINDNNAEIEALLTKITATGASEADIAAATQSIRDLIASNKAEVDKAKAATG